MTNKKIILFSPSGVVLQKEKVLLAAARLQSMGYDVKIDKSALKQYQRFAGADQLRLDAIHRIAQEAPDIALAIRGGYGLTRIIDDIDWKLLKKSPTLWVGLSDITALNLALLAHTKKVSLTGPLAVMHFAGDTIDRYTKDHFINAIQNKKLATKFKTKALNQNLKGILWGGNLSLIVALIGTPHFPKIKNGLLFIEDIDEHPYRLERMLLQLHQAGILNQQSAIILGDFGPKKTSPNDRGYTLKSMINFIEQLVSVPVIIGLPYGHIDKNITIPIGAMGQLEVKNNQAILTSSF